MAKNPRTLRKPGILFRLTSQLPADVPKWQQTLVTTLDLLLQKIWMALDNSLPGKHGATHRGGSDNIMGSTTPSTIAFTAEGSAGTPQNGAAPIDHVHPVDLNFVANPIPQGGVEGNRKPPFRTLARQTDYLTAQAVREYAVRPIIANTYR